MQALKIMLQQINQLHEKKHSKLIIRLLIEHGPRFGKIYNIHKIQNKYIGKGYIQNVNTGYLWIVRL